MRDYQYKACAQRTELYRIGLTRSIGLRQNDLLRTKFFVRSKRSRDYVCNSGNDWLNTAVDDHAGITLFLTLVCDIFSAAHSISVHLDPKPPQTQALIGVSDQTV